MAGHQSLRKKINYLLVIVLALPPVCFGATWTVDQHSALHSIQHAADLAGPYDTVLVHAGVYQEKNLVISRPLLLRGISKPVLDGEMKYEIISVRSSNVTVEGFVLRNGRHSRSVDYAGIKIYEARNVTISNNILTDMLFGIYFQGCKGCIAAGNTIRAPGNEDAQTGNGIHCWKCDSMTIKDNNISGQRDGIYFEFVTNSAITNNYSHRNIRYGLHFMFSHHNQYLENTFENNGSGVVVMYTNHVRMIHNVFRDNWGTAAYGLLLKEIDDSEVRDNQFTNNSSGIYMEGSSRIIISHNNFINNGSALRIQASCENNTVEKNNFEGNTFDVTTNGSLILNNFNNNYWDKYEGYDLNRDGKGDVPYHPVSVFSMIIERMPVAMILLRSFMVTLLEKTEKAIPSITPENFRDDAPNMKPLL